MRPSEGVLNSALDEPFVKALVGEPRHHSAYEVSLVVLTMWGFVANIDI